MDTPVTFVSTTNMLLMESGKVLLVKRSETLKDFPGWYMLPGGKQEPGETPVAAAIRETFEETGIRVRSAELREVLTNYHEYKSKVYLVNVFVSSDFEGSLATSAEGVPQWVAIGDALASPKLYPDLRRVIELVANQKETNVLFPYHRFNANLEIIESR